IRAAGGGRQGEGETHQTPSIFSKRDKSPPKNSLDITLTNTYHILPQPGGDHVRRPRPTPHPNLAQPPPPAHPRRPRATARPAPKQNLPLPPAPLVPRHPRLRSPHRRLLRLELRQEPPPHRPTGSRDHPAP